MHSAGTQEMTKTLSSPLSPLVMRVSESRYVTSNSPLPVLEGGLNASGIRGTSNGGNCAKFPAVFTVVFSNTIFTFEEPGTFTNPQNIKRHSQDLQYYNTAILMQNLQKI